MKELYAYCAGLIDGEGSITLLKNRKSERFRHPVVSVTSTSNELLQILKVNFGGTIKNQKVYKSHHKQSWSWTVHYNSAIHFIECIYPYSIELRKKNRMTLILAHYKSLTNRNGKYTDDEIKLKLQFETTFLSS